VFNLYLLHYCAYHRTVNTTTTTTPSVVALSYSWWDWTGSNVDGVKWWCRH